MLADPQPHVVCVIDRGKIQMPAPDKWCQTIQKCLPCGQITRTGSRLDIGRAFPGSAKTFIVSFSSFAGQTYRRDRWIRSQPQIGSKHISLARQFGQQACQSPCNPHEHRTRFGKIFRLETGFIKEADQINVRRIIQLMRAHLAHRQCKITARTCGIIRPQPWQLATLNLLAHQRLGRKINSQVGKICQRACDLLQCPNATKICKGREQRNLPLSTPQGGPELWQGNALEIFENRGQHVFWSSM